MQIEPKDVNAAIKLLAGNIYSLPRSLLNQIDSPIAKAISHIRARLPSSVQRAAILHQIRVNELKRLK